MVVLLMLAGIAAFAQNRVSHRAAPAQTPAWAQAQHYDADAHVYFPDYYIFYDPQRGGYLYWDKDNYVFSKEVPPFLQKVDLAKSRIQVLKGLSLDLHPELSYPYYMRLYPAVPGAGNLVPVPIPGNPAQY
jgi:hypothetical protein